MIKYQQCFGGHIEQESNNLKEQLKRTQEANKESQSAMLEKTSALTNNVSAQTEQLRKLSERRAKLEKDMVEKDCLLEELKEAAYKATKEAKVLQSQVRQLKSENHNLSKVVKEHEGDGEELQGVVRRVRRDS